ncbi:unnamed protein product, partial [Ectocarpus sp. 12 AP-2014]
MLQDCKLRPRIPKTHICRLWPAKGGKTGRDAAAPTLTSKHPKGSARGRNYDQKTKHVRKEATEQRAPSRRTRQENRGSIKHAVGRGGYPSSQQISNVAGECHGTRWYGPFPQHNKTRSTTARALPSAS